MPLAEGLFTVDGLPAHPLLVDAVAVLLPLAALCSVGLAVHRKLRRRFGWPVLALTFVAVLAVPLAQVTGRQLRDHLGGKPDAVLLRHEQLGGELLPYALGFGVAVVFLLVAGRLADRERAAAIRVAHERANADAVLNPPQGDEPQRPPTTWRRLSVFASVLVVAMAVVTTVEVVRIGTTGAQSVWQGSNH
ncbi:MAG TPA: DUF2231 domain-containing protein [Pseudonocardiaceae bacterium]|jgi:hypothetical protein|nr:DUF2231 domain-containing protein [Pseudonocardiaceae bacterium]